jgi:hypothetical protein
MTRISSILVFSMLALLAGVLLAAAQAPGNSSDLERIRSASVFIMQTRSVGNALVITCVGSGTLVSRDGLVLTNAHNTLPSADCPGDILVIALTVRPDEPPVPKYRAEIAQADPGLDLALLRITREADGRLIEPGTVAFPFAELVDSSQTQLDETITIVGYPGIEDDPVSDVRGTVSGFTAEPSGGEKSWIKTRANIPGTMSGGGAYNRDGQLIGVPTTAPLTVRTFGTTCKPIQDTNVDGLINAGDVCIAIGNDINALRPSNFARPLLRAAALGLSVETLSLPAVQTEPAGIPTFRRLFFSPSVVDGMPTTVVRNLPAGTNSLYLFFDYENMTPETIYELRVAINDIPNSTFSLAPVRWSGGEHGLWYIGSSGQPWPQGVYDFTLVANGVASETRRLVIGGVAEMLPTLSSVVFALEDLQGNIFGNGYVLPTGNTASARFIYQNMVAGTPWTAVWYYNGVERVRVTDTWGTDGSSANGAKTISIQDANGLPPGNYRLELYLEESLAATSDFAIAGAQKDAFPEVFVGTHFATGNTPQAALTANPVSTFPNTVNVLYALFDWQQLTPGTLWTMRWLVDGDVLYQQTVPWSGADSGQGFLIRLSGADGIPDGTYQMDLLINQVLLDSVQAQVGIGQLPIDRLAQATGVQLRGQILDADTHLGISGVTFVLLSEDFSIEDFTWDQSQIYASAITDRNGRFRLSRLLEFDVPYSVVIAAQGYLPITADGVEVTAETAAPLDMTIYLTRD